MRPAKAILLALIVFIAACRTVPTQSPQPILPPVNPETLLREFSSMTDARHALQATLKLSVDGPEGQVRSASFVVVERPAKLYVEVKGALRQVMAVLVTDGVYYELARNGGVPAERGVVHTQLLYDTARIPLQPEEAVAILLGAPLLPDDFQVCDTHPREGGGGEILLNSRRSRGCDSLRFDAEGRLVELQTVDEDQRVLMDVRYGDFKTVDGSAIAHRIQLEFPLTGTKVGISLRDVALNPALPAGLFDFETRSASNPDQDSR